MAMHFISNFPIELFKLDLIDNPFDWKSLYENTLDSDQYSEIIKDGKT